MRSGVSRFGEHERERGGKGWVLWEGIERRRVYEV